MPGGEPAAKRVRGAEGGGGIEDKEAVDLFQQLLRFRTVSQEGHTNGANTACVEFLQRLCQRIGLETQVLPGPQPAPKPILLATWRGADSALPSLLLNSHYDVVPVVSAKWQRPSWDGARITGDPESPFPGGPRIYGRGAQDMKCVCMQYIVAVSRLRAAGFVPPRDVHLSFVPDEEVGGGGMAYLTKHAAFKALNVECALDEGLCNTNPERYTVFYGERTPWWVEVKASGPTGHGSRFIEGCATHCLHAWLGRALAYRRAQEKEMKEGREALAALEGAAAAAECGHAKCARAASRGKLGDVTTMNLTAMRAGVTVDGGETFAVNVIPIEAYAALDVRVPLSLQHSELKGLFTQWCREAEKEWDAPEGTLQWGFVPYAGNPLMSHHTTPLCPETNKWWAAFKGAVEKNCGMGLEQEVFPAATDSRFLRAMGIHALGFSPINSDPILLHEHDEYLSERVYVRGCGVYETVVRAVAGVEA